MSTVGVETLFSTEYWGDPVRLPGSDYIHGLTPPDGMSPQTLRLAGEILSHALESVRSGNTAQEMVPGAHIDLRDFAPGTVMLIDAEMLYTFPYELVTQRFARKIAERNRSANLPKSVMEAADLLLAEFDESGSLPVTYILNDLPRQRAYMRTVSLSVSVEEDEKRYTLTAGDIPSHKRLKKHPVVTTVGPEIALPAIIGATHQFGGVSDVSLPLRQMFGKSGTEPLNLRRTKSAAVCHFERMPLS